MSLRFRLREETSAAHASIERYLAFDAPSWTLARYQAYLRLMHAFHRDVEAALASSECLRSSGLVCAGQRKTDWLARDLECFALQPLASGPGSASVDCAGSRVIGWSYVLEGATLGGRVLYKAVAGRWSLDEDRGAAYLHGYGRETSQRWMRFTQAIDAIGLDEAKANDAVAGANEAFAAMEAWFRGNGWHGQMRVAAV